VIGGLFTFIFLGQFLSAVASHLLISEFGSSVTFGLIGVVLMMMSLVFVAMKVKEKSEAKEVS